MKRDTVCRMCSSCCPVKVEVEGGRLLAARRKSFLSQEKLTPCPKLAAAPEITYSAKRLTTPLIREKGGVFRPAGWDEALELVASRFNHYKSAGRPEAVAWLRGMAADWGAPWDYANRLMNCFGSPNTIGNGSICFVAREMAHTYTYGAMAYPEPRQAKCILVWGKHDFDTTLGVADGISAAMADGAKLIVVDPIRTPLAEKADIWLQVKPGHDGLLAMAMINEIISQNLHDLEFIKKYSSGFAELRKSAAHFNPDQIGEKIWLEPAKIRAAARLYAKAKPACLIDGNGLDMQLDIFQATRAVACLRGLTGNIDKKGGDVLPQPIALRDIQAREELVDCPAPPITKDYPLFNDFSPSWGHQVQSCLIDAIRDKEPYPVEMAVVQAGNPVVTMADSARAKAALESLDTLVVIDMFMTKTAELADIILPAAGCFEKSQLNRAATRNNPIILQSQVIEPHGDSWPDWQIVFELGRRLGLAKKFPWQTAEAAMDHQLQPVGVTVAQLRDEPDGLRVEELRHEKHRTDGFATPSSKFEFSSARLQEHGFAAVPYEDGLPQELIGYEERKEKYPFIGISGRRDKRFTNSQYRTIPSLLQEAKGCQVDIHPTDAGKLQIAEGDQVEIATPKGSITMAARIANMVHPGSVRIAWGWGDYRESANLNNLTDDRRRNPITGTPACRTFRCSLRVV
ncbi:MAG: molybdopterin-dependent oxidoreductase [Thermodesulfobacteriota bacterium]